MSLLQDLGARLRDTADELPVGAVVSAADRLRVAGDLLAWVRQASARPMGVPHLAHAVEHLEHATHALWVARERVATYLAAVGLAAEAVDGGTATPGYARPAEPAVSPDQPPRPDVAPLRRWWTARVDQLTGAAGDGDADAPAAAGGGAGRDSAARDGDTGGDGGATSTTLLRRVVGCGTDRRRLRAELRRADPPIGLGLAALTPVALRRLATDVLGHPPRAQDVQRLAEITAARVRQLLPNVPPEVPARLLRRACRAPEPDAAAEPGTATGTPSAATGPAHPADSAIAGAVLTSVLLERLGRDPSALDGYLVPVPEPEAADA